MWHHHCHWCASHHAIGHDDTFISTQIVPKPTTSHVTCGFINMTLLPSNSKTFKIDVVYSNQYPKVYNI